MRQKEIEDEITELQLKYHTQKKPRKNPQYINTGYGSNTSIKKFNPTLHGNNNQFSNYDLQKILIDSNISKNIKYYETEKFVDKSKHQPHSKMSKEYKDHLESE